MHAVALLWQATNKVYQVDYMFRLYIYIYIYEYLFTTWYLVVLRMFFQH